MAERTIRKIEEFPLNSSVSEKRRERILEAAASLLASAPYETVSLNDVAAKSRLPVEKVEGEFPSMHAVASALLTLEGRSMRDAQHEAIQLAVEPLKILHHTFRLVGQNLATNLAVRAGIRIAGESSHCFPDHQINPYRTWEGFVIKLLSEARAEGILREDLDLHSLAHLFVSTAMGTKDLIAFKNAWTEAPKQFDDAAKVLITLVLKERN